MRRSVFSLKNTTAKDEYVSNSYLEENWPTELSTIFQQDSTENVMYVEEEGTVLKGQFTRN